VNASGAIALGVMRRAYRLFNHRACPDRIEHCCPHITARRGPDQASRGDRHDLSEADRAFLNGIAMKRMIRHGRVEKNLSGNTPFAMRARADNRTQIASPNQYLDPRLCNELLGGLRYGRIGSLPVSLLYFQLHYFLRDARKNYAPEIGSIPRQLLEHNLRGGRSRETSEMLPVDADVVFEYEAQSKQTDITFKTYFDNPGFERPPNQRRVVLHVSVKEADGVRRSVSVPLQALMMGWGDIAEGYQGYAHTIAFFDERGTHLEQWAYIGVTSRNWLERMEEHLQEIRSGSNKRFHVAWRRYTGNSRVILGSELVVLNHSFEGIMAWEEEQVDATMAKGSSLNMIPGGFKGLRFLHEQRITKSVNISLEERERAIVEYVRRRGVRPTVPNLLLAQLWRDDEFYLKVLAGRENVLAPDQVLAIRRLAAEGKKESLICELVGARNVGQVKRVLAAKTYRRVL